MNTAYQDLEPIVAFSPVREKVEEMIDHLGSATALGMRHEEVEEYVVQEGREVQRRMLQAHFDLRKAAERPVEVMAADGVKRKPRRHLGRALLSVVGPVEIERLAYQGEGANAMFPLDASLNLPPELYSYGVRRRVVQEVWRGSFEDAVNTLAGTTGAPVQKRQVEELAARAAQDFEAFYAARPVNDVREAGLLLVLTFDGAGIVVRKQDLRPATRKAAEESERDPRWPPKRLPVGKKKNRKRMAEVAAVYGIAPFPRTPEDIVRELRPVQDTAPKLPRPKPVNKRAWASVEADMEQVIADAFDEADRRDPQRLRRWVALVDGNGDQIARVLACAEVLGVEITLILDVIHVLEYLWKAAYCFHKAGSAAAETWVSKRLVMLLDGVDASSVAAGMTRSATLNKVPQRKAVDTCARYLRKNRALLHYGEALAAGLPIATGVIEGACRYLIRDRMDKTGAQWSLLGAEAILKLRAICSSGDFEAYWIFHLAAEYERNHVAKYLGGSVPSTLPSTNTRAHLRRVK